MHTEKRWVSTASVFFLKSNLILLALGLATLVVGYICLSRGPSDNPLSVTVAPLLLILAYCVIIPVAIIKKSGGEKDSKGD